MRSTMDVWTKRGTSEKDTWRLGNKWKRVELGKDSKRKNDGCHGIFSVFCFLYSRILYSFLIHSFLVEIIEISNHLFYHTKICISFSSIILNCLFD